MCPPTMEPAHLYILAFDRLERPVGWVECPSHKSHPQVDQLAHLGALPFLLVHHMHSPNHTLGSEDCLMPTGLLPPPGPRPWGSMSLKNGESWIMPEYSRCPNTAVSGELDYAQIWSCYHVGVPPNPPVQCRA